MSAAETGTVRVARSRASVRAAYVACALSLASVMVWMGLAFGDLGGPRLAQVDFVPFSTRILFSLGCTVCGAVVFAHPSGGPAGGLLLVAGTGDLIGDAGPPAAVALGAGPDIWTAVVLASVLGTVLYTVALYVLPLLLPTGRLPRGRRGQVLAALIALWTVAQVGYEYGSLPEWYGRPSPLLHAPWSSIHAAIAVPVGPVFAYVAVGISVLTTTVMLVRWRQGRVSPQRTGWLGRPLAPLALMAPFLVWEYLNYVSYFFDVTVPYILALDYVAVLLWPLGLGLVFVRDRSGHLDRAGRRALTLLAVLVLLVLGFTAFALLLSRTVPGSRTPGALVLGIVALLAGLLTRTVGGRAVSLVDRFYYGDRAEPYRVVRELAERLSRAVNPAEAPRLLCETVVDTLRFPAARVLVSTTSGPRETAALGSAPHYSEWHRFELSYEGSPIGLLEAAARAGEGELDQQDHDVLRFLADQAAPAVASLRLYQELQASRERIVLAREETRRQLRRDLHDGLAPALAGLRLQVDTAQAGLGEETPAAGQLAAVSQGIADAITELRRINDGLAPAMLDRGGLGDSLRHLAGQLTSRRLVVEAVCDPDPLPPLPAAVEVAVYRIAAEALHNVVRHAGARNARLRVRVVRGSVTAEIGDDGGGIGSGPPSGGGLGLRSMAERAAELGGTLSVLGNPLAQGAGVLVRAVIPVREPD